MTQAPPPDVAISRTEFVALMAMLSATVAFSVDAMLPGLPDIGAELSPDDVNRAQLVITSFVLGMGLGTFIAGPLSDTYGRKRVMLAGSFLYILGAVVSSMANSLEVLLLARVAQGLGASGPRVVSMATIRDLYAGRGMARIISFVMIVFTLVPAIGPLLASFLIDAAGWRSVFWSFVVFSVLTTLWLFLRLPETHPVERRRPFRPKALAEALIETVTHPIVRLSILVQTLAFAVLFSMLSSVQQIYDITYGRGESFPWWFGFVALVAGSSGFLNAALVMRLGMQALVSGMMLVQIGLSGSMIVVASGSFPLDVAFGAFVFWQISVFFMAGMTLGNLNSIAQEPLGHIAGMAASVIGSVATVGSLFIAIPVGLAFNGTPIPLAIAICACSGLGYLLMRRMARVEANLGI